MQLGYARVFDRNEDEHDAKAFLLNAGVEPALIFIDRGRSGQKSSGRVALGELLARCSNGDTVVVASIDRLARSLRDLHDTVSRLSSRGVTLRVGTEDFDPSTPDGSSFVAALGVLVAFESDLARARFAESAATAALQGRRLTPKPKLTAHDEVQALALLESGKTFTEVASRYNVSTTTLHRARRRRDASLPRAMDDQDD